MTARANIDINDPRLTAYALGELPEHEASDLAAAVAAIMTVSTLLGGGSSVQAAAVLERLNEQIEPMKKAAEPVRARWIADMKEKGIDGEALIKQANELIDKYQ